MISAALTSMALPTYHGIGPPKREQANDRDGAEIPARVVTPLSSTAVILLTQLPGALRFRLIVSGLHVAFSGNETCMTHLASVQVSRSEENGVGTPTYR